VQSQRQEDLWPRKEFAGEGVLTAFERSSAGDRAAPCTGLCCAQCHGSSVPSSCAPAAGHPQLQHLGWGGCSVPIPSLSSGILGTVAAGRPRPAAATDAEECADKAGRGRLEVTPVLMQDDRAAGQEC